MTTTLTRPRGVRRPYFRPLAARAARVTGVLATALVAGQYVTLLFGLAGFAALLVGGSVTIGIGILAHAAVNGQQRWAVVLTGTAGTTWRRWARR